MAQSLGGVGWGQRSLDLDYAFFGAKIDVL